MRAEPILRSRIMGGQSWFQAWVESVAGPGSLSATSLSCSARPRPSRLGFGTSGLMGSAITTAGRLRLLEVALDEGITHFDTAPLYGAGLAEEMLGRFAKGKRHSVTITTKFGLLPRQIPLPLRPLLPMARLARRGLRRFRPKAAAGSGYGGPLKLEAPQPPGASGGSHGQVADPRLNPAATVSVPPSSLQLPVSAEALRQQLHTSLRKLKCDYVDFYLLHDCGPADVTDSAVAALESLVQEGKIRSWGVATGRWGSRQILEGRPDFAGVVQIPDHLLRRDTAWFAHHAPPPLFSHSALRQGLADPTAVDPIVERLVGRWARYTGRAGADPALLSEILLLGGLHNNPQGCVIFSSGRAERIGANARILRRWGGEIPELAAMLAEEIQASDQGADDVSGC